MGAELDLIVIGSGPAGLHAAISAAKAGRRAAIVEKGRFVGGVCINIGTIPSKSLREAVLYLSGWRERAIYGMSYAPKHKITVKDLLIRTEHVVRHEVDVVQSQLFRNDVELIEADARFEDAHTLRLTMRDGSEIRRVTSRFVVIATGSVPTRVPEIDFDDRHVFTSDTILGLEQIPKTMVVIGGGVIGCEYASFFSALGVRVTLVDTRDQLLPFADREIVEALEYQLRSNRVTICLGEKVVRVELSPSGQVRTTLRSGKIILSDCALCSFGRTGATAGLDLPAVGLSADEGGRIPVDEHYQTAVPTIYAVGDVIGFPALASTSMEQGRLAACHAFGIPAVSSPALFPYGIYTIPEISMIGRNEHELTRDGVPYEVGKAWYREIARGQILGDEHGMLKLIFHRDEHKLLGVHAIGEGATELIHIGQAVMALGGRVEYFVDTVFNYPTLAEAYKVAAFDGLNRLAGRR